MAGRGKVVERDYTHAEREALMSAGSLPALENANVLDLLGRGTRDVFINDKVFWRNVPEKVWDFTIGGYQVLKKWLSYRERPLLGRGLLSEEVDYVTEAARRLAAILLLGPALDENYRRVKEETYPWSG